MDCCSTGSSFHGISQARILQLGCHFLLQGGLPNPGMEPVSSALAVGFYAREPPRKPKATAIQNVFIKPLIHSILQQIFLARSLFVKLS